jgi:cyclase
MDTDGTRSGYETVFLKQVVSNVTIPVIASGGAGKKEDFLQAFKEADVDACLAAGLFHYNILPIKELKEYLKENKVNVRI